MVRNCTSSETMMLRHELKARSNWLYRAVLGPFNPLHPFLLRQNVYGNSLAADFVCTRRHVHRGECDSCSTSSTIAVYLESDAI